MSAPAAVVLDIEGTTGSLTHVREVLFPFARDRFARWFAAHRGTPLHQQLLDHVTETAGAPAPLDEDGAVTALRAWTDADVKAAPLKTVQALIWAEGYAEGSLTGHVYADVPPALERWARAGVARYIYSSGARQAQRDWFAHTAHGDLTGLLNGYFDLESAGAKRDPASYRRITGTIGAAPGRILFLSDVTAELDAAATAGWQTVLIQRDAPRGEPPPGCRHPVAGSLAGLPAALEVPY